MESGGYEREYKRKELKGQYTGTITSRVGKVERRVRFFFFFGCIIRKNWLYLYKREVNEIMFDKREYKGKEIKGNTQELLLARRVVNGERRVTVFHSVFWLYYKKRDIKEILWWKRI